jgi:UTP--glucose-1-phosphate uridylyltransferase
MRPATRSVPKALLPVVDRPAIQWIVEEAMHAGVGEAVVIVNPGVDDLLYAHFEGTDDLEALEGFGGVKLTWVVQEEALGLGHAVLAAREAVGDRPFFVALGDNLVVPGHDPLGDLGAASDGRAVMCLREQDDAGLEKYGVIVPGEQLGERLWEMTGAVEKPGVEAAPSRLGFVGRYLFTPAIFDILEGLEPGYGGEIQLTDGIDELARTEGSLGWVADADLLDVGTPPAYLEATTRLGLWHPATQQGYREFLRHLLEGS